MLAKMLRLPPKTLAPIFSGNQKISFSKKPLDFQAAVKLKVKLLRLGLVTEIQPWKKTDKGAVPATEKATTGTEQDITEPPAPAQPATGARPEAPVEDHETDTTVTNLPPQKQAPGEEIPTAQTGNGRASSSRAGTDEVDTTLKPTPNHAQALEEEPSSDDDSASDTVETTVRRKVEAVLIERLEEPPHHTKVINEEDEADDDIKTADTSSTSETVFLEHPYTRRWWSRISFWPTAGIMLLLAALLSGVVEAGYETVARAMARGASGYGALGVARGVAAGGSILLYAGLYHLLAGQ
jgi:hypothetical protein